MSYSYYPKKLFTSVFNGEAHPLRILATAAAFIAAPVYYAPEVIYQQPSDERTATIGDAQYKNLDQSLTQVLTLRQESVDATQQARIAYQTVLANSDDKNAAQVVREMDSKKSDVDYALLQKARSFEQTLMLSEGISEKDAEHLMVKYKTAIPDAFSSYRDVADVKRQAAYLDECQIKTLSDKSSGSSAASSIESCIDYSASRQGFWSVPMRILTGFGGAIGLMAIFGMAGGMRRSVEEEEARRSADRERAARETPKTDTPKKLEITVFRKK